MALCCSDIAWASVLPVLLFVIPEMAGIQIGASIYLRRQTVFPAKAGIHSAQLFIEVLPFRVRLFDQFYFPSTFPTFDSLLSGYGSQHGVVRFVPN